MNSTTSRYQFLSGKSCVRNIKVHLNPTTLDPYLSMIVGKIMQKLQSLPWQLHTNKEPQLQNSGLTITKYETLLIHHFATSPFPPLSPMRKCIIATQTTPPHPPPLGKIKNSCYQHSSTKYPSTQNCNSNSPNQMYTNTSKQKK